MLYQHAGQTYLCFFLGYFCGSGGRSWCTDTVVTYASLDQILCPYNIWVVRNIQFDEKKFLRQNLRIY